MLTKIIKLVHLFCFALLAVGIMAQEVTEKVVSTEVGEVTVFLEGAQVVRKKPVTVSKGISVLKFVNLSPYVDAKSLQVKAGGALTILSVSHQTNYLDKQVKPSEFSVLEKQLEQVEEKIKLETVQLAILAEELSFLKENRVIGGKNEQTTITNLQQTSDFYSTRLTALKLKEIEREKTVKVLNLQKSDLQKQLSQLSDVQQKPTGEVLVKIESATGGTYPLELTYMVGNAGWFPSYDIRATTITEPVQLIYKASVRQNTLEDWKNVKLRFSSAMPNLSGVSPELNPYLLDYNVLPPSYDKKVRSVRGKVIDTTGDGMPGASVTVKGTTIGTVADTEGHYSLTLPASASTLQFSYIGYATQQLPVTGEVMNVTMMENTQSLEEVMVVGYGTTKSIDKALQGRMAGLDTRSASSLKIRGAASVPVVQQEKTTAFELEVKTPYTILSDNKSYSVDMAYYDIPADFQYYAVPKIEKDVFLQARIADWEGYNLLEGEANIFFENTFVGKTLLDVRNASDTLTLSLGRDKKVMIQREKMKELTTRQFIGSKQEEVRSWKTVIRNTKSQPITIVVLDQVPVSTNSEIEVSIQQTTGVKPNAETGELKWEFVLQPDEKKELELKYSVRYPKNRQLYIE